MLKISFFFKLEWLKILKDIFEKDYPIVATEISHNFISLFYSEVFLCLAEMVEKFEFLRTKLRDPYLVPPNFVIL